MSCDIILILGCMFSIRRLLLALLSLPITPDGPTDGRSERSIRLSAHSPASMSYFSLSYLSVQIPELDFYLPVNHRFIVISHMINNKTERGQACCDAQQMPDTSSTMHNNHKCILLYFVLRAMLLMLVSVVELWSISGALTGLGESLPQLLLFGVMLVSDPPLASCSAVDSWHP